MDYLQWLGGVPRGDGPAGRDQRVSHEQVQPHGQPQEPPREGADQMETQDLFKLGLPHKKRDSAVIIRQSQLREGWEEFNDHLIV